MPTSYIILIIAQDKSGCKFAVASLVPGKKGNGKSGLKMIGFLFQVSGF